MITGNLKTNPPTPQEDENIPFIQSPSSSLSQKLNCKDEINEQDNEFLLDEFIDYKQTIKVQDKSNLTLDSEKKKTQISYTINILQDKTDLQDCLLHKKPLDILCLNQKVIICSSCALFGDHKGHQFRNSDEIQKDILKRQQQVIGIIQTKSKIDKQKAPQLCSSSVQKLLNQKKKLILSKLNTQVQKLINEIQICQKACIKKINQQFQKSIQKYQTSVTKLTQVEKQYQLWQQKALTHIENLSTYTTFEQKVKGLKKYNIEPEITKNGKCLISSLQSIYRELQKQKSRSINNVQIIFDISFINKLKRFAKIQTVCERQLNLVGFESKNNISLSSIQNVLDQPLASEINIPNLRSETSLLSLETSMLSNRKSPLYKSQLMSPKRDKILRQQMNSRTKTRIRSPTKPQTPLQIARFRRIKLKLPEKYDRIMQEVLADTTEIFDLTNGQLGNEGILQMLELLKTNNKVKTVKLGKNRLNDDIIPQLWNNLSRVQTLNLSNNFLTQKIIDSFMNNLSKIPLLKNIVLTQNKLIARSLKPKIEQLKQNGILLTL